MLGLVAILLGLCFGSFLNVLIIRIPQNKSVVLPPSSCNKCGNKLKPYHNIPVLSYIFLGGKCGFCKSKISIMYPMVEVISGILAYAVYLKFDYTFCALFIGLSILLLFALCIIDLKTLEVPDSVNFSALIFAIIGGILYFEDFLFAIASAFSLAGFFTLLRFAMQTLIKKDVLGEGDIIVVATMGALLGWKITFFAIFLSAVFALVILLALSKKDYKIPFVPFLFLGTLPCLFFPDFFNSYITNYLLQA